MARHPSLEITDEQEANLRTLAAYLLTLPADYPDFAMRKYTNDNNGNGSDRARVAECGTAACAAGHGPLAGIAPLPEESWGNYSYRAFAPEPSDGDGAWAWCFSSCWSFTDNTAHGAAKRILWMLEHSVPENAWKQRTGKDPLCYTDFTPVQPA